MRRRIVVAAGLLGLCATPAYAQNELLQQCAQLSVQYTGVPPLLSDQERIDQQVRVMCGHVASAMTALQPGIGIAFSGGNPVLGTGTTLGTRLGFLPRVSVTGRANVALVEAPDVRDFAGETEGGQLPPISTTLVPLGALQADLLVGVFNGISLGPMVSGLGAVDLLGSVSFFPKIERVGMQAPIFNVGGGARVGILGGGLLVPAVSVSAMYRRMSDVQFFSMEDGHPGEFRTELSTLSGRLIASKGLVFFDLALGAGYDRYAGDVGFGARVREGSTTATIDVPDTRLKTSAWNVFGNVGINMLLLKLVAEVGYQNSLDVLSEAELRAGTGVEQPFSEGDLKGGKLFGSIGLRLAI